VPISRQIWRHQSSDYWRIVSWHVTPCSLRGTYRRSEERHSVTFTPPPPTSSQAAYVYYLFAYLEFVSNCSSSFACLTSWQQIPTSQLVSRQVVAAVDQVQCSTSPCGICGGQSGTGMVLYQCRCIVSCQYPSTNIPYTFAHLPPTLYNLRIWQDLTCYPLCPPILSELTTQPPLGVPRPGRRTAIYDSSI
jgi:hypothetical protein